jgi:hypothetical protein
MVAGIYNNLNTKQNTVCTPFQPARNSGCYAISNPEPAIHCGGLLGLWETPANFVRKSVHLDPVPRSTFINRHYCRQTWIMPLFKLITTLILKRPLTRVLNCSMIPVVIYFILFNYGKSWIVVLLALRVMPILVF